MIYKDVEYSITVTDEPDIWQWRFQIGGMTTTGKPEPGCSIWPRGAFNCELTPLSGCRARLNTVAIGSLIAKLRAARGLPDERALARADQARVATAVRSALRLRRPRGRLRRWYCNEPSPPFELWACSTGHDRQSAFRARQQQRLQSKLQAASRRVASDDLAANVRWPSERPGLIFSARSNPGASESSGI